MIARIGSLLAAGTIAAAFTTATWNATLEPMNGTGVRGEAEVVATDSATTTARITLKGGEEGAQHTWHVVSGTCENPGAPVGDVTAYTPLAIGADSSATGQATLTVPLDATGEYAVNVRNSTTDDAVVACGALKAAAIPATEQ